MEGHRLAESDKAKGRKMLTMRSVSSGSQPRNLPRIGVIDEETQARIDYERLCFETVCKLEECRDRAISVPF